MRVDYVPDGDITADDADIVVNTVNCVGIMGKGVALAFKKRWPGIMQPYKEACSSKRLRVGGCMLFPLPDDNASSMPLFDNSHSRWWAALATKDHWMNPSKIEWIETGLQQLAQLASEVGARSIAIPPPGCGNGGLDWRKVEPMVLRALDGFDLHIYGIQTVLSPSAAYKR